MALQADKIARQAINTPDGKWVCLRPEMGAFITRIWDAILVLIGKADAVVFHMQ